MLWIMWNHCLSNNIDKKDLDKVEVILGFKITRSKKDNFFEIDKVEKILKKYYYLSVNLQVYIMIQV